MKNTRLKQLLDASKAYFKLNEYKENEEEVIEQVRSGVVFRGPQLWILMFAILIASLGLNVNSTAVIIGAMLISPLMGPIIGIGLSVGIYDFGLFKQSLKNYLVATIISIITATIYFWISPISEARSELLARTAPTLYDVLIAFCGGAAGVLALTTKGKGQVIPGVAIATALMPPLCTAGYGLATLQWSYFLGAFYLFFINTVFIALATFLGIKLLKFEKSQELSADRATTAKRTLMIVVIITLIPAAIITWNIIRENAFNRSVNSFIKAEIEQTGTQILSSHTEHDTLHIVAVGRVIEDKEIAEAQAHMANYGLGKYTLAVIQGNFQDSLQSIASQLHRITSASEAENRRLSIELAQANSQIEQQEAQHRLSKQMNAEARALFPQVERIYYGTLDEGENTVATAVVVCATPLGKKETSRLKEWLAARADDSHLQIVIQQ